MAFNGFNGTVEKINDEKRKLEVMVKIFGRKTPLELSFMQVEKYNFFVTSIIEAAHENAQRHRQTCH
jgi:hypothetical protein